VTETARGRYRRERLLDATADLVAERGFHRVGIAEIGAAAGVSGAAIYRHFASKDELLVALIDRVVDELLDGAREICARARTPEQSLRQLVEAHVQFALRERSIIKVYDQEAHHLPDDERRRLRRMQRAYAETWVDVVLACPGASTRLDWSTPQAASPPAPAVEAARRRPRARAVVHGVFGLVNSVADFHTRLARDELATLLQTMAEAVLERALQEPLGVSSTMPSAISASMSPSA
jgi:AcrR family transcriptional regulator